jgi:uncharacterized protein YdeI (YjbR/CyaY-like superfamily)
MKTLSQGTAHKIPDDLKKALLASPKAVEKWEDITPLSRNEWICWTISVKKEETRKDHTRQVPERLMEGQRRPCCWVGCTHRGDKKMSKTQKWVQNK